MILFDDRVMKPRLLCPAFHCFIVRWDIKIVMDVDGSIVFICRDDEEMGMFYVNVFVVEFTGVKFEVKCIIIICSVHDCDKFESVTRCIYSHMEKIERCHDQ